MRFVIVGNSAAALSAVEGIRRIDRDSEITVISDERHPAYSRILITYYLAGKVPPSGLGYVGAGFYSDNGVTLATGCRIDRIDAAARRVFSRDGRDWPYDRLLVATGSTPVIPAIPGSDLPGVMGMRTLDDAQWIKDRLPSIRRAVISGGGLVGFKTAEALIHCGVSVTMVVSSGRVLSQMLDSEASRVIGHRAASAGVNILTNMDIARVAGNGRVESVELTSGREIPCDLVVFGKGVTANTGFLDASGAAAGRGLTVDRNLRTSLPCVYAAGDVAEAPDLIAGGPTVAGVWPVAIEQGYLAGLNMAGKPLAYDGVLKGHSSTFFGLPVASVGIVRDPAQGTVVISRGCGERSRRLFLRDGRLVGALLIGDISEAGPLASVIRTWTALNKADLDLRDSRIRLDIRGTQCDVDSSGWHKLAGLMAGGSA